MKCPHCLENFFPLFSTNSAGNEKEDLASIFWSVKFAPCPSCKKTVIYLVKKRLIGQHTYTDETLINPRSISRTTLPPEVPLEFTEDYKEACLVLSDSPKASAALSRRCLQNILRENFGAKHSNLDKEIQEVLDRNSLPTHISDGLDAVRNIGNFAAHPIKSKSTGKIVPVEEGEAEWNLDVVESLFDYCFVAPAKMATRKAALNKKLEDAGKPKLK